MWQSLLFSLVQISQGLLIHPYQTMQSLVRESAFVWMALLPTLIWGVAIVCWRYLVVPVAQLIFSCQQLPVGACELLPFFADWLTFFCLYWQILLGYLLVRFVSVFQVPR